MGKHQMTIDASFVPTMVELAKPKTTDMRDGDVVLVRVPRDGRLTEVPIVIQLEGDVIQFDIYLHDGDEGPDRSVRFPISDLEAGWDPQGATP